MFKKPKRNFRRKINTSDSENENDNGTEAMDVDEVSQDSLPSEPASSHSPKPKEKKKKSKAKEPSMPKATLSFGLEEEGGLCSAVHFIVHACQCKNREKDVRVVSKTKETSFCVSRLIFG